MNSGIADIYTIFIFYVNSGTADIYTITFLFYVNSGIADIYTIILIFYVNSGTADIYTITFLFYVNSGIADIYIIIFLLLLVKKTITGGNNGTQIILDEINRRAVQIHACFPSVSQLPCICDRCVLLTAHLLGPVRQVFLVDGVQGQHLLLTQ